MTSLSEGDYTTRAPAADAVAADARLLLGPVRLPRDGAADPIDEADWFLRESWDDHQAHAGPRPRGGLWLIDVLDAAELTGCGGGFFPAARKWRAALATTGRVTVVANASESESLSAKDATLLRQRPHLVLDGLELAAETLGASCAVVWLHADDVVTRLVVEDALAERRRSANEWPIEVIGAPGTYIAGESSAIANALAGGPALPTFRGFGPNARGNGDRPATVVHNVETLARAALLARAAVRRAGAEPAPCLPAGSLTTLVTVLTASGRQVLEAPSGTSIADAVRAAGWPDSREPSAILLGGFGGVWARWDDVADAAITESALRSRGAILGAGILAPLPASACGLAETAAIVAYLSASSARQCGPCLFGLASLSSRLEELRFGRVRRSALRRIAEDLAAVRGRGACHHPDGAVGLIASAVDVFADDVARHASGRPCASVDATHIPVPRVH